MSAKDLIKIGVLGKKQKYLFCDNFSIDKTAGTINGSRSSDGKSLITVADTENKFSVSGGKLVSAGGRASPGFGNPALRYNQSITRKDGLTFEFEFTQTSNGLATIGFFQPGTFTNIHSFYFVNGSLYVKNNSTDTNVSVSLSNGTSYYFKIILTTEGCIYYYSTDAGASWKIVHICTTLNTASLCVGFSNYNQACSLDFMRVYTMQTSYSFYDNFDRANGALGYSDSGYQYYVTGANTMVVSSSECDTTPGAGSGYAYVTFPRIPTVVRASFYWKPGSPSTDGICIACADSSGSINQLLHFVQWKDAWNLQVRIGGGSFDSLISGSYLPILQENTPYRTSMSINGNTVLLELPDGTQQTVTDARVGTTKTNICFWELGSNGVSDMRPIFTSIGADFK